MTGFFAPPVNLSSPPPIGNTTPNTGAFTALSGTGTFTLNGVLLVGSANLLEQRNGVNAQGWKLYSTYSDASNYGRLDLSWSGAYVTLKTMRAGTGGADGFIITSPDIYFGGAQVHFTNTSGDEVWGFAASTGNAFLPAADITYSIGSATKRVTKVFADLQTNSNATTGLVAGALAALTNATIVIYDGTGTAYRVPCVTP